MRAKARSRRCIYFGFWRLDLWQERRERLHEIEKAEARHGDDLDDEERKKEEGGRRELNRALGCNCGHERRFINTELEDRWTIVRVDPQKAALVPVWKEGAGLMPEAITADLLRGHHAANLFTLDFCSLRRHS